MLRMELQRRLQHSGIRVTAVDAAPGASATCEIAIPKLLCQPITDPPSLTAADDGFCTTTLHYDGSAWSLELWDTIPGPGLDDVRCAFPNLDAAIAAVLQYHLGGPTQLGPWVIPLHRHPELALELVRLRLRDAPQLSQAAFDALAERRRDAIFGNYRFGASRWDWALQTQFLPIPHRTLPNQVLYLRRDAQEAYVVADATE